MVAVSHVGACHSGVRVKAALHRPKSTRQERLSLTKCPIQSHVEGRFGRKNPGRCHADYRDNGKTRSTDSPVSSEKDSGQELAGTAGATGGDEGGRPTAAATEAEEQKGNALSRLVSPKKAKWTKMSAKGKARQLVMEPISSFSGISDYLALPLEEYNLLDPTWIEREEGEDDVFHFTVPMPGIGGGITLEPQTWVKVDIDTEKEEVRFSSSRIKLGDAEMDAVLEERVRFTFESRLSYSPLKRFRNVEDVKEKAARVTRVPYVREADGSLINVDASETPSGNLPAGEEKAAQEAPDRSKASLSSISANGEEVGALPDSLSSQQAADSPGQQPSGSSETATPPPTVEFGPTTAVQVNGLDLEVSVKMEVLLPKRPVIGTGMMMGGAGKVILKAALKALAPAFVRLVSEDYKQWVAKQGRGERSSSGSLVVPGTSSEITDV